MGPGEAPPSFMGENLEGEAFMGENLEGKAFMGENLEGESIIGGFSTKPLSEPSGGEGVAENHSYCLESGTQTRIQYTFICEQSLTTVKQTRYCFSDFRADSKAESHMDT